MTEHFFGGLWTELKLEVLKSYLSAFTTAMKNQSFVLYYIDACAGTGERSEKKKAVPILGIEEGIVTRDGSAKIALQTEPPFDHYFFFDKNRSYCTALESVVAQYPDRKQRTTVECGDANQLLKELSANACWSRGGHRGVVFLDPYGLEIDWETLQAIASTRSLDVWFLFSLSGVIRQASKDYNKMESYKKERLTRLFGTNEWEEAFYRKQKRQGLLFELETHTRSLNVKQIEEWVKDRLTNCFPFVDKPLRLPQKGPQLYSLFFCLSNDSPKAIGLAKKLAGAILSKARQ